MKSSFIIIMSLFTAVVFSSCEHDVTTETTVHPDGSLDKTFTLEVDSKNPMDQNRDIFLLGDWDAEKIIKEDTNAVDSIDSKKIFNRFSKKFNSAEEANLVLAKPNDTLFLITSQFEKKFKWFYTYIKYSETFHALNRMNFKPDDYLTPEDYAFINRLPAEGKQISKADNFYLDQLNNRIFDIYGVKALYEENFELTLTLLRDNNLEQRWIDTLNAHKESIFNVLESKKDLEENFMLYALDSLNIPIDVEKIRTQYDALTKKLEAKVGFITTANDGKYINRINLPWDVVSSNADSVVGNSLLWAPPTIKFLLKDYTMYGECRKLNWWAVIVSVLFIGFTGYLFIRKRK